MILKREEPQRLLPRGASPRSPGPGPLPPALGDPAWAGGWAGGPTEGPANPDHAGILGFCDSVRRGASTAAVARGPAQLPFLVSLSSVEMQNVAERVVP